MNAAREKVRVANALGELPKISASYAKGEISYSKVRAQCACDVKYRHSVKRALIFSE